MLLHALVRRPVPAAVLVLLALVMSSCGIVAPDENAAEPTVAPSLELLPQTDAVEPTQPDESQSQSRNPQSSDQVASAVQTPPLSTETLVPEPTPEPDRLACLSTRQRVAQLLLPLATQPELRGAIGFAAAGELGGIGLLGAPDAAIADELTELQRSSFVSIMVASDEEGGSVQRLANLLGPIPSAAATAQSKTPEDVRKQWVEYGARVRALGIDVIFGPVVDVGSGPGIESRSFGEDPDTVAAYGRAVAEGLIEGGVRPVFKHFPGHGRATADSHLTLPTTPSFDEMVATDLVPYAQLLADPVLKNEAAVMIGHLSVPGLSDEVPTSLSPETINGLLRTDLGFGGLVFSDAINMGAIVNTYGLLESLELSILAGVDIIILGSLADLTPALDHLVIKADSDDGFAAVVNNRATRVLAAKGQSLICAGAE